MIKVLIKSMSNRSVNSAIASGAPSDLVEAEELVDVEQAVVEVQDEVGSGYL